MKDAFHKCNLSHFQYTKDLLRKMKVILTACPSSVGIDPVSVFLSIIETILITIKNQCLQIYSV